MRSKFLLFCKKKKISKIKLNIRKKQYFSNNKNKNLTANIYFFNSIFCGFYLKKKFKKQLIFAVRFFFTIKTIPATCKYPLNILKVFYAV